MWGHVLTSIIHFSFYKVFVQLKWCLRKAKVIMPIGIQLKDLKFLPKIAYEYINIIHTNRSCLSLKYLGLNQFPKKLL